MFLAHQCLALNFFSKMAKNAIFRSFNLLFSRKVDMMDMASETPGVILFAKPIHCCDIYVGMYCICIRNIFIGNNLSLLSTKPLHFKYFNMK